MKINIIGAGVAGLSVGCYLQMNGFETEIFERHSTFGGLCTSWQRDGYTFESGLQWLLGSGSGSAFYQLWSELINMESIRFVNHKVRMAIETSEHSDRNGSKIFYLYSNLDQLESYLLTTAPEDGIVLKKLLATIRRMQRYEIPPLLKVVPELLPWYRKIEFIRHIPLLLFLTKLKRETNFTFAAKLKNPFLKEAFSLLFDGEEKPLMIITLPLAFNDLHGTGYPVGGSVSFVSHLERKYRSLGGKVRYNTEVSKISTSENHATGLQIKTGEFAPSEITISAADWHFTLFDALDGMYVNEVIRTLQTRERLALYSSVFMVSLGVKGDFSHLPHFFRFPIDRELISPDGTSHNRMEVHINNYDSVDLRPGRTSVSVSFYTRNALYWIDLRKSDPEKYREEKEKFAQQIIQRLEEKLGDFKHRIEVTDVATPATYHRFTNNWNGSVQGWEPGKNILERSPIKYELPGLSNFYFIGHWTIPGGGLPVAIKSARDVALIICHREKVTFKIISESR